MLTGRPIWDGLTGVLLGLTFLAHAAPTLVFVGLIGLMTAFSAASERRKAVRRLTVVAALSLLVASPFLLPLVLRYRLTVQNTLPAEYVGFGATFVLMHLLTLRTALAVIGLVAVLRGRFVAPEDAADSDASLHRAALLAALVGSAGLLFGYGLTARLLFERGFIRLPRVVPTYHFFIYMKAVESLLFGAGLAAVARVVAACGRSSMAATERTAGTVTAALLMAIVAIRVPGYLSGIELTKFRAMHWPSEQRQTESPCTTGCESTLCPRTCSWRTQA